MPGCTWCPGAAKVAITAVLTAETALCVFIGAWVERRARAKGAANAFASGVFLATTFMHLLPHANECLHSGGTDDVFPLANAVALVSFLLLVLLELVIFQGASHGHGDAPEVESLLRKTEEGDGRGYMGYSTDGHDDSSDGMWDGPRVPVPISNIAAASEKPPRLRRAYPASPRPAAARRPHARSRVPAAGTRSQYGTLVNEDTAPSAALPPRPREYGFGPIRKEPISRRSRIEQPTFLTPDSSVESTTGDPDPLMLASRAPMPGPATHSDREFVDRLAGRPSGNMDKEPYVEVRGEHSAPPREFSDQGGSFDAEESPVEEFSPEAPTGELHTARSSRIHSNEHDQKESKEGYKNEEQHMSYKEEIVCSRRASNAHDPWTRTMEDVLLREEVRVNAAKSQFRPVTVIQPAVAPELMYGVEGSPAPSIVDRFSSDPMHLEELSSSSDYVVESSTLANSEEHEYTGFHAPAEASEGVTDEVDPLHFPGHTKVHQLAPRGELKVPLTTHPITVPVSDLNADTVFGARTTESFFSATLAKGFVIILAVSIHSLFESVALGLMSDLSQFISIALAIGAHRWIMAVAVLVRLAGFKDLSRLQRMALFFFFVFVLPVGVILGSCLLEFNETAEGIFIAITAGTFLFLGTEGIFSELEHTAKWHIFKFKAFLWGCGLVMMVQSFLIVNDMTT